MATSGAAAAGAAARVGIGFSRSPIWAGHQKIRAKEKLYHRNLARARGATDPYGKPIFTPYSWNVTRGDLVEVTRTSSLRDANGDVLSNEIGQRLAKPYLGMQGVVLRVLRKEERIVVKGVNMRSRVQRVSGGVERGEAGGANEQGESTARQCVLAPPMREWNINSRAILQCARH
jgi:hypothetical protein